MFRLTRNLGRLHQIAATLGRHDAFFPLDPVPKPRAATWAIAIYRGLYRRRGDDRAPGLRLAAALTELGPSFIKLGQALSVRPDLIGGDVAADLGRLRDRLPPFPAAEARRVVETETGRPLGDLFASFDDIPVAAASIAQVHFAVTADGRPVAVKLLRPGIEAAFQRDIDLMTWLADLVERAAPQWRRLAPRQVVDTIAQSVRLELDLRLEAAAAAELAENFQDDPDLAVPAIDWQRTGRRMLTMQRIGGIGIDDVDGLRAAKLDLPALSARVIRVFLKQTLRDGFFHADLHHGNVFVGEDGRLMVVDFGIMGRLDRATRGFMADILYGFVTGNYRRVAEIHFAAGYVPADRSVDLFGQACRAIGEPILGRPVTEISIGRLLGQLFEVTEMFGMRTQPHLLLLQKTMVTVEGVARSLDPQVNIWTVSRPTVEDWMKEAMSPTARLKDEGARALALLQRLPGLVDRLERHLDAAAGDGGLRLDPETLAALSRAEADTGRPLAIAGWAAAALLAAILVSLWL